MKLWLDDVRKPPDETWKWVKTAKEAIELIESDGVTVASFDHDLGGDGATAEDADGLSGYDVAKKVEELAYLQKIHKFSWAVHSANPAGVARIRQALEKADFYWANRVDPEFLLRAYQRFVRALLKIDHTLLAPSHGYYTMDGGPDHHELYTLIANQKDLEGE